MPLLFSYICSVIFGLPVKMNSFLFTWNHAVYKEKDHFNMNEYKKYVVECDQVLFLCFVVTVVNDVLKTNEHIPRGSITIWF